MGDMADDLRDQALDQALHGDEWHDPLPDSVIWRLFFSVTDLFQLLGFRRAPKPDEWATQDRKIVKIKKMETTHLRNTLNYIARHKASRKVGAERMKNLRAEAKRRGLEPDGAGGWRTSHSFDVVKP